MDIDELWVAWLDMNLYSVRSTQRKTSKCLSTSRAPKRFTKTNMTGNYETNYNSKRRRCVVICVLSSSQYTALGGGYLKWIS